MGSLKWGSNQISAWKNKQLSDYWLYFWLLSVCSLVALKTGLPTSPSKAGMALRVPWPVVGTLLRLYGLEILRRLCPSPRKAPAVSYCLVHLKNHYFSPLFFQTIVTVPIKGFPLTPPPTHPTGCFECLPDKSLFIPPFRSSWDGAALFVLVMSWWVQIPLPSFRPVDSFSHFLPSPVLPLCFSTVFWDRLLICSRWRRRIWRTK